MKITIFHSVRGHVTSSDISSPAVSNSPVKRICVIRHGRFPEDARVRKEVTALLDAGYRVDVLCLRQDAHHPFYERNGSLTITRIPLRHVRRSLAHYIWEYIVAFILFSLLLTWRHLKRRYDFVQVNTMPDALVFCTLVTRMTGAPVILDVHEPTPQLWITKYGGRWPQVSRLLRYLLRAAVLYADKVLTVTDEMKNYLETLAHCPGKITVIPNVTDLAFGASVPPTDTPPSDDFVILTHGLVEERYGHDLVIRAVHRLAAQIPNLRYEIIGEGECVPALRRLTRELGCEDRVCFRGFLPFADLIHHLRQADVGIIAMTRSPYSQLIDTNKMYELMVLGIPVIHSRLPVIDRTFTDDCIEYFTPGDSADLERAILRVYQHPDRRRTLSSAAKSVVSLLSWDRLRQTYTDLFADQI